MLRFLIAALMVAAQCQDAAAAEPPSPPTIDCALGFSGLRAAAEALPGASWRQEGGYDIATMFLADAWRAQIAFTQPGHPAHPAVTLRTQRKQVTEVWTSDSKGCGYGSQSQFGILMADMKSADTELTSVSRLEVERRKLSVSPLSPAP